MSPTGSPDYPTSLRGLTWGVPRYIPIRGTGPVVPAAINSRTARPSPWTTNSPACGSGGCRSCSRQRRPRRSPAAAVLTATGQNLEALARTYPYLVVDCWAPWCGPCRRVGPVVEALAGEFAGRIAFAKLNTDEHPQVARRYGISAIPTLLLFRSGGSRRPGHGSLPD